MLDFLQGLYLVLGPWLTTFLLGFATILISYWHSTRKQNYWKDVGIPYVKPVPFIGSLLDNTKKSLHEVEPERFKKYGRVYGHYEGNKPLISIAEPDLIRNILVKDFFSFTGRRPIITGDKILENMLSLLQGEDWKRVRTIVTPTFSTGKIKRMMGVFKECSRTLVENFKKAADKGEPVEAKTLYGAFTMDVIASSAFSTKIDSHNDPNNIFAKTAQGNTDSSVNWRRTIYALIPGIMKFLRIRVFSPNEINFFAEKTLQIIEERKKSRQKRNDFLQMLMDTAEELVDEGKLDMNEKSDVTENYGKDENDQIFKPTNLTKKTLSLTELVAQCVIFFLAGYDTTASTLSFTSYALATNPDVQEKLIREVDDTLKENDGELTYEAVQSMKYLDNVISETLRIYSPGIRLERVADQDYKLGDTGVTIPKGMLVTIPIHAIHSDPENFPDPEKFDPNRFTPEERAKRNQYAYVPFGAGPRNCVAMRFALVETKVCLAYVLSNFRIKKCPQTLVPLEFYVSQGVLKPKDVTIALEVRKDTVKAL